MQVLLFLHMQLFFMHYLLSKGLTVELKEREIF